MIERYQQLFDLMATEYGIYLIQTQMDDIVRACLPMIGGLECSEKLAELLTELRAEQKGFFAAKPGTEARKNHYLNSRQLEKELDAFLQQRKAEQADTQHKLF